MNYRYFIGVDPGVTGSIAIFDSLDETWDVFDTPVVEKTIKNNKCKSGFSKRHEYNLRNLESIFLDYMILHKCEDPNQFFATVEKLHANPAINKFIKAKGGSEKAAQATGTIANFLNGEGMGTFKMLFTCLRIPYVLIPPQTWKKHQCPGVSDRSDKEQIRIATIETHPDTYLWLQRVKDHNRAEAVQLASFGHRFFNEGQAKGVVIEDDD